MLDHPGHARSSLAWSQVFLGGLLVAAADIAFATTYWFSWTAPGLVKVFQAIAVGALGKASFEGGMATALLGAGLQWFMASMFVLVYALVGKRVPALLRKPFVYGVPYGLVLYVVMNFVVMPLSRVGASPSLEHPGRLVPVVVAHLVFGVVCAWFAGRALRRSGGA